MSKLKQFIAKYPEKEFEKDEEIIIPGDNNKFVYYLEEGHVASYALDEEGNEITLNIYKKGNIFPISEVLANRVNDFFFEALEKVKTRKIPSKEFLTYIKNDRELLFQLTQNLSIGLEGFMIRTLYLIRTDARKKVASALVMMARRFGEPVTNDNTITISLPQTHEDIARLAGVSRETVSIEMKKMQDEGLLERNGKTTLVKDFDKLKESSTIFIDNEPLPYTF